MTVDEGAVLASLGRLGFGPASFLAAAVACFFESCFCQPLDFAAAAAAAALEADSMAMSGSGGSGGGGSSSGGSGRGSVRGAVRHARLFSEEEVRQVLALGQRLRRRAKPRTFGGSPSGHVVTQVAPQPPTAAEQAKNLYSVAKHSRLKTLISGLPSRTPRRPPPACKLSPEFGAQLPGLLERLRALAVRVDADMGWGLVDATALVPRTVEYLA